MSNKRPASPSLEQDAKKMRLDRDAGEAEKSIVVRSHGQNPPSTAVVSMDKTVTHIVVEEDHITGQMIIRTTANNTKITENSSTGVTTTQNTVVDRKPRRFQVVQDYFPFMLLAPEIRNRIYELCLTPEVNAYHDERPDAHELGLEVAKHIYGTSVPGMNIIKVNKQLHREALPFFYSNVYPHFHSNDPTEYLPFDQTDDGHNPCDGFYEDEIHALEGTEDPACFNFRTWKLASNELTDVIYGGRPTRIDRPVFPFEDVREVIVWPWCAWVPTLGITVFNEDMQVGFADSGKLQCLLFLAAPQLKRLYLKITCYVPGDKDDKIGPEGYTKAMWFLVASLRSIPPAPRLDTITVVSDYVDEGSASDFHEEQEAIGDQILAVLGPEWKGSLDFLGAEVKYEQGEFGAGYIMQFCKAVVEQSESLESGATDVEV